MKVNVKSNEVENLEKHLRLYLRNHRKSLYQQIKKLSLITNSINPTWLLTLSNPFVMVIFQYDKYNNSFKDLWLTRENLMLIQSLTE
jgi:hypothetical protein